MQWLFLKIKKQVVTAEDEDRAIAMLHLVPHLPESLKEQGWSNALIAAKAIAKDYIRPNLPEGLRKGALRNALIAIATITDDDDYVFALIARLARLLPESLLHDLLHYTWAVVSAIPDKLKGTTKRATLLHEALLRDALATAKKISNIDDRISALVKLAPHLPEPLRGQALWNALAAASALPKEVVSHLPEALLREALDAFTYRTQGRIKLAPYIRRDYLPTPLQHDALVAILAIKDEHDRISALRALIPLLTGYLPTPLQHDALAAILAIKARDYRVPVLIALIPYLTEEPLREQVLLDALMAVPSFAIDPDDKEAKALTDLSSCLITLPITQLYPLWCKAIHFHATQTRSNLLSMLSVLFPVVETLGGEDALIALAEAIIEAGKWFP